MNRKQAMMIKPEIGVKVEHKLMENAFVPPIRPGVVIDDRLQYHQEEMEHRYRAEMERLRMDHNLVLARRDGDGNLVEVENSMVVNMSQHASMDPWDPWAGRTEVVFHVFPRRHVYRNPFVNDYLRDRGGPNDPDLGKEESE